jgi:hypothetical protein
LRPAAPDQFVQAQHQPGQTHRGSATSSLLESFDVVLGFLYLCGELLNLFVAMGATAAGAMSLRVGHVRQNRSQLKVNPRAIFQLLPKAAVDRPGVVEMSIPIPVRSP